MKITFAGCGSAFDTVDYQSNLLIETNLGKRLLFDCGSFAPFALEHHDITRGNVGQMIHGVYISHLHADHIGGLEWLGFLTYFNPQWQRIPLYIMEDLIEPLWQSLSGGMRSIQGKVCRLETYFDVHPIKPNLPFHFQGITCQPVQTVHVMNGFVIVPSYGLLLQENRGPQVYITADTQFAPEQIKDFYRMADTIFHDCEIAPFASGVHAHYSLMENLPPETKAKMWLYHGYSRYGTEFWNPLEHGFAGRVQRGQAFEF